MTKFKTLTCAALAALAATLLFPTPTTLAGGDGKRSNPGTRGGDSERGDREHRDARVTFTKWITQLNPSAGIFANMAGEISGGDVGDGVFTGEALTRVADPDGNNITVEAVYHIHGSKHSFTALVHAVQPFKGVGQQGVITGVVTDGWLKGQAVKGEWTVIPPCGYEGGIGLGNCFDVTLDIERVAEDVSTFTKWVTDWPNMAGVVGGAVGGGSFAGEVLTYNVVDGVTKIDANYHFHGPKHSFTALVHVEQTDSKAVIIGVVTDGWLKGHAVNGKYTQITLAHDGVAAPAYQGTLEIEGDSKD
jgi:hypothetical protein